MKIIAKISLLVSFFCLSRQISFSQNVPNYHSFEFGLGRSGIPGNVFKLSHERYLADKINVSFGLIAESSNRNKIAYKNLSIDAIANYYTNVSRLTKNKFQLKFGAGFILEVDQEEKLLKNLTTGQRINEGILAELAGEWAFSKDFSLTLTGGQRLLFNKQLGSFDCDLSIGVKYKFF